MLIVLNGMLKYLDELDTLDLDKRYITTHEIKGVSGKQIVVEDLGYRLEYAERVHDFHSISRLAEKYLYGFKPVDKRIIILLSGRQALDLGFTIELLNKISELRSFPEVVMMIETPRSSDNNIVKARFYASMKIFGLYDILFNYTSLGAFKYIFVDPDQPGEFYNYMVTMLNSYDGLSKCYSTLHLKFKRLVIPLLDLSILSELLVLLGKTKRLSNEYKFILWVMHRILDKAPTELWSIARKKTDIIRGSFYSYRELVSRSEETNECLKKLVMLLSRGSKYTASLVDPRALFEKLSSGTTLSNIYVEFSIEELYNKIKRIDAEDLLNIYSLGTLSLYIVFEHRVLVGEDIASILKGKDLIVLKRRVNELSPIYILGVPINTDCGYNTEYIPMDIYEAYMDQYSVSKNTLYPQRIIFRNQVLDIDNIHNINMINYLGYRKGVEEECIFIGRKTIDSFIANIK
ncbi:MAG: hypothetical protein B6U89_00950 [Desulfurococcales archaeon ex4484_58]|nr:MAG: hypothetical protein B6U89_00950 [Desulfurococcales archaeon ex4484_58]